jgi:predicted GNAT family N-acyltransferase
VPKVHGGNSRSASKQRKRAALLSQRMHHGDGVAAFRLLQRGRALKGIKKLGWRWRLAMANAARKRNHEELLAAKAAAAERRRIEEDCTVTSPKVLAALRVRYGTGLVRGDYAEGECRPVAPGGKCPACAWRWGDREPHIIAVPF